MLTVVLGSWGDSEIDDAAAVLSGSYCASVLVWSSEVPATAVDTIGVDSALLAAVVHDSTSTAV